MIIFNDDFNYIHIRTLQEFEIVYKYEKSYETAIRSIQNIINEKYLSKDELNDEKLSNLKEQEVYI